MFAVISTGQACVSWIKEKDAEANVITEESLLGNMLQLLCAEGR